MVRCCHDDAQNQQWIQYACHDVNECLDGTLWHPPTSYGLEDSTLVHEGAANDECICEMQTRHRGQLVDIGAADPHTLGMILANGIAESKRLWKKSRWHTRPEREDDKSREVAQRYRAACNRKHIVRRCGIVVPGQEPKLRLTSAGPSPSHGNKIRTLLCPGYGPANRFD